MPTRSDNASEVKIAVLNNDIKHINDTLARMEQKFDLALNGFVTVEKLNDAIKESDAIHQQINERLKKIEKWFDRVGWLIISAVILAILGTVLVSNIAH